ncbi:twin-arginine translocase subunit TatC [Alicyclobacillus fodiniaquatilis]|uniref:Sec-independent protein translocase protein TatC n=1 Tax=Alicyclobacillus fodiniaquatilis TaxID=1661150 RepID=A0ABW4JP07_9BACL
MAKSARKTSVVKNLMTSNIETDTEGESFAVMSWVEHLEELRKRIMIILGVFIVCLIVSLIFVNHIYHFLIGAMDGHRLTVLSPGEVIGVYMTIAGGTAIGVTLPFAVWQSWIFVRQGLTKREQKIIVRFVPMTVLVFIGGACFGYFVVFHLVYHFLLNLAQKNFSTMITAGNYFGFMGRIVIPFGFLFEMPIVMMFLARIGVLTPRHLAKARKYAYLVMVVIASILSPPEFISHISVAAPLILLYEISVSVAKIAYRRRQTEMDEYEENRRTTA